MQSDLHSEQPAKSAVILIVDDEPKNIALLAGMLKANGYQVRAARSADQAMKSLDLERVDLIMLDIRMPGMSGYQACEQLKQHNHTADIPIIFLSAMDEVEDKVKGLELGAVDYITKPFNPDEVLARIKRQLQLKREYRKPSGSSVYRKTGLNVETRKEICRLLKNYFDEARPYLSYELSAAQIAENIGVSQHNLSEAINIELQQNLSQFINQYRIHYFCEQYAQRLDAPVFELAIEAGFRSKSVFNHWFKAIMNTTPKLYIKSLQP